MTNYDRKLLVLWGCCPSWLLQVPTCLLALDPEAASAQVRPLLVHDPEQGLQDKFLLEMDIQAFHND